MAALREKPDAVVDACRTLGLTHLFMPAVPPDERDMAADGWRSLGRELGQMAERFQAQGIRLGYHNHHWELKPKDGAQDRARTDLRGRGSEPPRLAGRRGLARARRRRSQGMDRPLPQPGHRRPREGHRARRAERGPGRLGRCRRRHLELARPLARPAARPAPNGWWSSTTSRQTRRRRPATASPSCAISRIDDHGHPQRRHHRMRQHLGHLPSEHPRLSRPDPARLRRHAARGRAGSGKPPRHRGAVGRSAAGQRRHRSRGQPHRARPPISASRSRR